MKDFILTCFGVLNPEKTEKNLIKLFTEFREVTLYLIFGALTTIVGIVTFALFLNIFDFQITASFSIGDNGMSIDSGYSITSETFIPNVCSWICAVIFAFIVNKIFVFKSTTKGFAILGEIYNFVNARLLSGIFDIVFCYFTIDVSGISSRGWPISMKIISNVFVLIMNYVFSKLFVFKKEKAEKEVDKQTN